MVQSVLLHAREHLWLWVAALAALGLALLGVRLVTPGVFAFMLIGVLIMLKSQGTDILAVINADPTEDEAPAMSGSAGRIDERVQ